MPSLVDTHDRVKQVEWTPTYVEHQPRYPTRYKVPRKTKDPFRTLVREYLTMEQEKDDRQYGGFEDVLSRTAGIKDANPAWLEGMKLALPIVVYAEYGAEKCQSMLVDAIDNAELRAGYLAQAMDERRHLNQQMYLLRQMAKHSPDPAGFDRSFDRLRLHRTARREDHARLQRPPPAQPASGPSRSGLASGWAGACRPSTMPATSR